MNHPSHPASLAKAMLALPLVLLASSAANAQALREYWLNLNGSTVASLTNADVYVADMASGRDLLARLQSVSWNDPAVNYNWANNYGERITGYITAPLTGSYVFWVRGDNDCDFALSSDENPANAIIRCTITNGQTGNGTPGWNIYPSQKSVSINLVAGQRYFFRAHHKEGSGGDHFAIGWAKPGQLTDSPSEIIPGAVLTPYLVPVMTAEQLASRFLQQAAFGPRPADLASLANNGNNFSAWIDNQFTLPRTSVLQQVQNWRQWAADNNLALPSASGNASVLRAIIGQMITGEDQLRQKAAYALSQIFVISNANSGVELKPDSMADYYDMLSRNAFGNFRQLIEDVSLHPMMGRYLSHLRNQKADTVAGTNPDENYAREVMQLFSIGLWMLNDDGTFVYELDAQNNVKLDANGNPIRIPTYTNDEITNFARVFTGLTTGGKYFNGDTNYLQPMNMLDAYHDVAPKTLLAASAAPYLLPARTPSNPDTGAAGYADLAAAFDNLFHHPNTPPFISRLLIQRLVTSNPSPAYIGRVSAKFKNNGAGVRGDMKAVWKAILTDPEARDLIQFANPDHGRKREPWEQVVHLLRSLDGYTTTTGVWAPLPWDIFDKGPTLDLLGVYPLRSPSVFNFYLPNYLPPGEMTDREKVGPEFQIHTASLAVSAPNTLFTLVDSSWLNQGRVFVNLAAVQALSTNPAALVDRVALLLNAGAMSPRSRTAVINAVAAAAQADRANLAVRLLLLSPDFNVLQ